MTKPYNIPPPWNPGYALPQNVEDEGLERHGYVTAMTPRGTYDNPDFARSARSAGYATPGYINESAYGQNSKISRWAPRGSYAGPKVKHWLNATPPAIVTTQRGGSTNAQLRAMAGVEVAHTGQSSFVDYGHRVAAAMLNTIAGLPVSHRKKVLKAAMDKLDPTLYARAEAAALPELKAGAAPRVALQRGIAHAVSHGMARQLVSLGRGAAPAAHSQLGSVMYSMGDLPSVAAEGALAAAKAKNAATDKAKYAAGTTINITLTKDPKTGVITQTSTSQTGADRQSGAQFIAAATARAAAAGKKTTAATVQIHVGPFLFPLDTTAPSVRWTQPMPQDWQDDVVAALSTDCHPCISSSMRDASPGTQLGALRDYIPSLPTSINHDFVSVAGGKRADNPIVKCKHPMTGEEYGLYLGISATDVNKPWTSQGGANPTFMTLTWDKTATGFWGALWDVIKEVTTALVDAAEAVASFVKSATCDLMTSSLGQVAGAAAGAAVAGPAGAQAGKLGAQVAAGACSSPVTCAPGMMLAIDGKTCIPIPDTNSGVLVPLLVLGGLGAAAFVILKKKGAKS